MKFIYFIVLALAIIGPTYGLEPSRPEIVPLEPGYYLLIEQHREDATNHSLPLISDAFISKDTTGNLMIEVSDYNRKRVASILTTKDAFAFTFTEKMTGPAGEEYFHISTFTSSYERWAGDTSRAHYRGLFSIVASPFKYDFGKDSDRFSEPHLESGRFMFIRWTKPAK